MVMKSNQIKKIFLFLPLMMPAALLFGAETAAGEAGADLYFYDKMFTTMLLAVAGAVILGAVAALTHLLNVMVKMQQIKIYQEQGLEAYLEKVEKPQKESFWQRMYKRWTDAVPVEKEKDIMFDHEFDGIRELDNRLPPWWVAMFYITIAFAVVYMTYYHFAGVGLSSAEAYELEMEKAEEAIQAYRATQANNVDETNVEVVEDAQEIAMGESLYQANCAVCHGKGGEGGVGPNMTDEYWIHGGSVKDIFKTIKYGVPENGMIAWQSQLRPTDMQRVASFILTLQGTNPPNAKEPQGELYQQAEETEATEETSETTDSEETAIGMNEE